VTDRLTSERFQAALRRAGQVHAERASAPESRDDEPKDLDSVRSPGETTHAAETQRPMNLLNGTEK